MILNMQKVIVHFIFFHADLNDNFTQSNVHGGMIATPATHTLPVRMMARTPPFVYAKKDSALHTV